MDPPLGLAMLGGGVISLVIGIILDAQSRGRAGLTWDRICFCSLAWGGLPRPRDHRAGGLMGRWRDHRSRPVAGHHRTDGGPSRGRQARPAGQRTADPAGPGANPRTGIPPVPNGGLRPDVAPARPGREPWQLDGRADHGLQGCWPPCRGVWAGRCSVASAPRVFCSPAIGAAAGFYLPDLLLMNLGQKRQEELRRGLADSLDMMTVCVEAGQGFDAALLQVARSVDGPVAGEFARVLSEIQIGKSRGEAFSSLGARTTVPEVEELRERAGAGRPAWPAHRQRAA